jgi:hypothetical protein
MKERGSSSEGTSINLLEDEDRARLLAPAGWAFSARERASCVCRKAARPFELRNEGLWTRRC